MKKQKILVTGVAGFVGSHLADRLLNEGYEVIGIDDLSQGLREQVPEGVALHIVDIRSPDIAPLFAGVDVVFHLAAKNSLHDCQRDPVGTMDINVVGTAQVFEAALRAGVRKVIYAQSSVLEEGEERREGMYAISKAADEMLAKGYHTLGLTTVGLRYFNVYGARQDYRRTIPPVMSAFIIAILKGVQPVLVEGSENNRRDFIHIDDVNDFHLLCINDERVDNRMFRIGTGKNHSITEVLTAVQHILGSAVEPRLQPRLPDDQVTQTLADITDAKSLGWQPNVVLEAGLRSMAEYIRSEIAAGRIS